jgi:predicted dehydrogenase
MPESQPKVPRIAVIGCGSHASQNLHPALVAAGGRIVSAADLYESNRDRVAQRYNVSAVFDDYPAALEVEALDGIVACGPPELHATVANAAAARGLPCLIEKPPAPDTATAAELAELPRVYVSFMKRFATRYQTVRRLIPTPTHVSVRLDHAMKSNQPGVMRMMTIHAIDLARFLIGGDVSVACAHAGESDGAVQIMARLSTADRRVATLLTSNAAPAVSERVEVTGQDEQIVVEEVATLHHRTSVGPWSPYATATHSSNFPLQTQDNHSAELQGYAGTMRAFLRAVAGEVSPDLATAADGHVAMRLGDDILKEARLVA